MRFVLDNPSFSVDSQETLEKPKRKLSPRTLEKIKTVTKKKIIEYKRDIILGDDFKAMKNL